MTKVIASYDVTYLETSSGRVRTAEIIGKTYRTDRGQSSHEALCKLWQAGFRPPGKFRVPRPYGYSAERCTLLQERARGSAWSDSLRGDAIARSKASTQAAGWLLRLQRSRIPGPFHGEEVVAPLRLADELGRSHPEHSTRLHTLTERLRRQLGAEAPAPVPSHGDFHPGNVFVSDGLTTALDLDHFALREPAFDVGYGIGQLLIMSEFQVGQLAPGAEAAASFWRSYHDRGAAPWQRVAAHIARTFLQSLHYELCVLRNGRRDLLRAWPDLAEYCLASTGADALEDLIRGH